MAAAPVAVVYDDTTKDVLMIVVPDRARQLNDPAFNPPGSVQHRLPRQDYDACRGIDDVLAHLPVEVQEAKRARDVQKRAEAQEAADAAREARDREAEAQKDARP